MTQPEIFLSMRNVSKRYVGVQALDAVDFEIYRGEIHCLVGENGSGKSTLIKIISGAVQPDPGAVIEINGETFHDYHALDAIRKGVEVIYQDLSLFPNLTVAENIALPRLVATGTRTVRRPQIETIAREAMARIGVRLPLDEKVGDISIADQQLVAICRALTRDVRLLIMDEPTASLTRKEVAALFQVVRELQGKGIATLFVSHKLDEVLQIAERVTVLRDGKKVGTYPAQSLNERELTRLMTGREVAYSRQESAPARAEPLLEVRGLSRHGQFRDISFELYPGEILGITGLLGSGRTELALALFGVNPPDEGTILMDGRPVRIDSIQAAMDLGIGYVPENRLVQGLVMPQSIERNIALTVLDRLCGRWGLLEGARVRQTVQRWIQELAIRVPSVEAPVQTLSGGNQQRVVLAKWLATGPRLLILDSPTVGIDVAAKSAIHAIIRQLASEGMGIIVISDEVPEVYYNCHRVIVMHRGQFIATFDTRTCSEADIYQCIEAAQ